MFNFKAAGGVAAAAFVVSILLGIIAGGAVGPLLLRALLFAVLFFALTILITWASAKFLGSNEKPPVDVPQAPAPQNGQAVNVTLDDAASPLPADLFQDTIDGSTRDTTVDESPETYTTAPDLDTSALGLDTNTENQYDNNTKGADSTVAWYASPGEGNAAVPRGGRTDGLVYTDNVNGKNMVFDAGRDAKGMAKTVESMMHEDK
jgi:hypothetical protein